MMDKDTLLVNAFSAGAITTALANLEVGLTLLVLATALTINLRKLLKKGTDSQQKDI
jgi:hypothetical protein